MIVVIISLQQYEVISLYSALSANGHERARCASRTRRIEMFEMASKATS